MNTADQAELNAFVDRIFTDVELQKKITSGASVAEVFEFAGFDKSKFSKDQFAAAIQGKLDIKKESDEELSDDSLANVAGGISFGDVGSTLKKGTSAVVDGAVWLFLNWDVPHHSQW
jgi:hypothetical protein